MVAVTISANDLTASGVTPTANARVEFSYLYPVAGDPIVSTRPVSVAFVGGVASFTVPVTPVDNALRVRLSGVSGYGAPKFFQIPNVVSVTWSSMLASYQVNPDTLAQTSSSNVWWSGELAVEAAARVAGDAASVQRANHTGTQGQSTVTNLVADLAAKVPIIDHGSTIGTSSYNSGTGIITVTVNSVWGVRTNGTVYYDSAGAVSGEAAVLDINPTTGAPRLTKIGA